MSPKAVSRIAGNLVVDYVEVPQDGILAENQEDGVRCGDNGIFKGVPVTEEQKTLSAIARGIFLCIPLTGSTFWTVKAHLCQSNASLR
jgi:S-adenosylmethionine synthetase